LSAVQLLDFLVWHWRDEAAEHGAASTVDHRGGFIMVSDPQQ